ncbi:MAG: TlpA family protein disulfide reductase [Nitrospirae bacterium]|nr:TlpA family protein disulfide reductase [Nitrospirota bacterium]
MQNRISYLSYVAGLLRVVRNFGASKFWALVIWALVFWLTAQFSYVVSARAAHATPWEADEMIGHAAPDFTLRSLNGEKITLSSLRGKVVLVNFWATWCEPCQEEMPSMNKLYNLLKDRGFVILALSIDDSPGPVKKFLEKMPVNFPILLDKGRRVSVKSYKVIAQPMSFLIDKKGIVTKKYFGSVDWTDASVVQEIEALLK